MRRVVLRAWVLCWLILVWMLLWGTVSAANILSGLVIALVITLLLPLPPVPIEGRLHPVSLIRLIGQVGYYLVLSSVQVAWLAVKPGPPPRTAVLRAHLALKSDLVLALAVNVINLIPGSIVLEIDQTRRMIYVHVIDAGSDRSVSRFYHQVAEVERLMIASFERPVDWQPATEREAHERPARSEAGSRMNTVWIIAAVLLTAAAAITMFRLLAGPGTLDRLVALDTFVAVTMCAIGTWAAFSLDTTVTYSLTALALISFVGSVSVARYRVRDTDRDDGHPQ